MRRQLFWSMLAVAALVLVIVAVGSAVANNRAARQGSIDRLSGQASVIAERLAERLEGRTARQVFALIENRNGVLAQYLEGLDAADDEVSVRIGAIDQGAVVFAGQPGSPGADSTTGATQLPWDIGQLESGAAQVIDVPAGSGRIVAVAYPISTGDGTLIVGLGQEFARLTAGDLARTLAVPLAVAAAVAALAAELVSRRIGDRLGRLSTAVGAIAAGQTGARVAVSGDDEIADVGRAVNDMADALASGSARERSFLMSVSHDLRTPLTTIAGYSEALENSADPEAARVSKVLQRETGRLGRLVEDIMTLARLESDQFTLRPELVDVAAHLGEVARGFEHRAGAAGIQFRSEVEPTGEFFTDPDRIAQVAANLMENALRHTPEAGVVTFGVSRQSDRCVVSVTDTGPGIDPADLPRIFDRHFVGRRHQRPEGSGLGLAIVRELVSLLEGTLEARAPAGGGTQIIVTLPAVEDG